jgi:hypothetical protein
VLMGHGVGRDGQAIQATSRYWLSARSSLQFGYRHEKIDVKYLHRRRHDQRRVAAR